MLITTKKGRSKNFKFQIDLSATTYQDTDVTDVWFVLKNYLNDSDSAAVLKKHAPDVTWVTVDSQTVDVVVPITKTEFESIELDQELIGGVFAEFAGEDAANEDVETTFKFLVQQDLLQDD